MKIKYFIILLFVILVSLPILAEPGDQPKAVIIIASSMFQDQEYDTVKTVLENNKIDVSIASSSLDTAKGMTGEEVKPDLLIEDIEIGDFDAYVFIGGDGADEYLQNNDVLDLVRDANKNNKVIGAISPASGVLANAGILRGKSATISPKVKRRLTRNGSYYKNMDIVISKNIITAQGQLATKQFADALVKILLQNKNPL